MLKLDFINVGYGDAILVRDVDVSFSMLVDCGDIQVGYGGKNSWRISAADFLRREGIQSLNILVLTHLHRDHSGGLSDLLASVDIKELWVNYLPDRCYWGKTVPCDDAFSAGGKCLIESLNILLKSLPKLEESGTIIKKAEHSDASVQFTPGLRAEIFLEDPRLFRRQEQIWQTALSGVVNVEEMDELDRFINNTSIRMRLAYGSDYVELPGDVYADCWEKHQLQPCSIVKLPHHGHKDSITPRILEMFHPKDAVISVSNTRTDDCPSIYALSELQNAKCKVHITDAVEKCGIVSPPHFSVHFEL